jgi:hypothetical protein
MSNKAIAFSLFCNAFQILLYIFVKLERFKTVYSVTAEVH